MNQADCSIDFRMANMSGGAGRSSGGLLTRIWNLIHRSPLETQWQVGVDHYGNRYYEQLGVAHSTGGRHRRRRWMRQPTEEEPFDSADAVVPPEWQSWLQNRREDIPQHGEIIANEHIAQQKKINAAKLAAERGELDPPQQVDSGNGFTRWEEYEIVPGAKKKNET